MGSFSCVYRFFKWAIILGILIFVIHYWLSVKSYLFTEEAVAEVAKKHIGSDTPETTLKKIHLDFLAKYPGHILPEKDLQWIFMSAGFWTGSVCLLHASLTEYVLFFGTNVNTAGHSGRYWANVTDLVLTGEFKQWHEGSIKFSVHKPGDLVKHIWGEATVVDFKAGTWMVEYGRGFIPSTLPFAVSSIVFTNHDFLSLFYLVKVYAKAMALEIAYYLL